MNYKDNKKPIIKSEVKSGKVKMSKF